MCISQWKTYSIDVPCMEPTDAVKLAYQCEFGCGHLLAEESLCAERIAMEIAETAEELKKQRAETPFQEIGGGLCRLNLRSLPVRVLPPVLIARMMAETARVKQGSMAGFMKALSTLRQACAEGIFSFSLPALDEYLDGYAREGYPTVSHSKTYRRAYAPAYRVVLREYGNLLPIVNAVEAAPKKPCVVAIDGDCGAGKTTLAHLLAPLYHASIISLDDFFLPSDLRTPARLAEPGGNIHYERFATEVLKNLGTGERFSYARYDCHSESLKEQAVEPLPVILLEGSYSHHPFFAAEYQRLSALRVWVKVSEAEQLRRLARRNIALLSRFEKEWIPMEKAYAAAFAPAQKADYVIQERMESK